MFLRATLAFLALPGVVAILVPMVWLSSSAHIRIVQPLGLLPLVVGFAGLLWCVRDFYVSGKGTFQLRVVLGEEPWLARTHGGRWDEYKNRVRRWL